MRVVVLNNDFRVYWKGRLLFLHKYLSANGIDVYAIELFGAGSPYDFDVVNKSQQWWSCLFPNNTAADLSKQSIKHELFKQLDILQPDIVIGPSIVFYAGALGLAWSKQHKRKFIMFDDAKPQQVKRNAVIQAVKDIITSQVDGFWLPSPRYSEFYSKYKKVNTCIFYGFSCIDNDLFKTTETKAFKKSVVCVARLVPIKNIDRLLRAWQIVQTQSNGAYTLNIIGNGPEEAGLKQLKDELGLSTVTFTDAVDNAALPLHLQQADAFILPSLSETWGLVVNEAMATGLPVLLSKNVNAAADLLQEGVNGYSFDPYSIEAIANAVLHFVGLTESEKHNMGEMSLQIIAGMSYEKMGANLLPVLKQLKADPFSKPGIIAGALIKRWYGRYNTAGWDRL